MNHLVNLNKDTRWGIETIGTKAFNLQKLMLLGMKVPQSFVITTDAFGESPNGKLTGELLSELTLEFTNWTTPLIARSSSIAEDTSKSSKAGVFSTVSDVNTLSDLTNAIEQVWSSSQGDDIAVIIQEQLRPDIAGVLFTRDPVSGENKRVIEYVKGMGESLVSGKKNPIRVNGDDKRFQELTKIGERLESLFGYPLDIEWAQLDNEFHILQARPITALPIPQRGIQPTYSMVLAEQFFSGPASPLFYSLFKFLFEEYYAGETARAVGLDVLPEEPLLIQHKDHMYVNTFPSEYLLKKARGLGNFQQQLKVLPEDIRKEFEDPQRKNVLGAMGLLFKIAFLLMKKPGLRKSKVDRDYLRKVVPEIISGLETIKEPPETKPEMQRQYTKLMEITIKHIRSSKWGLAYCIMFSSLMQRSLEKNHVRDPEIMLLALMSGLMGEKTSESIRELEILSKKYQHNQLVYDTLNREFRTYDEYRDKLLEDPHGRQFAESFKSILFRYGHRRLARDLIEPSWSSDPMIPFSMVRNNLIHKKGARFIGKGVGVKKRNDVEIKLLRQIPFYKRRRFKSNSKYLIRYLAFRELQRFYLDMIFSRMRYLFLTIGDKMKEEGLIEVRDDVFFLEINEIGDYLKGDMRNLRYTAAFRKMKFKESPEKPGLYLRAGVDFNEISKSETEFIQGNIIKGESVSAGAYKGKVKVIECIDSMCSISPGSVLVTKSIDPGQTQVFTQAGGLILEVGGILSHGAILAREFGIPTVAQVKRATKIFHDGQDVVVDGTKGEVVIIKNSENI
jgi:pyruvate,water dikinase